MLLHLQACTIDLDRMSVARGEEVASLTTTEARLLRYLLSSNGQPVPHERLLQEVWGYSPRSRSHTVRTTISRLRAKIEEDPSRPVHLLTEVGRGYRLVAPPHADPDPDPLVGRDAVLQELLDLEDVRLLEIVGPPGVGKTRIARALATGLRGRGRDVLMVELGGVDSLGGLVATLGSALDLSSGRDPVEHLGHALRSRGHVVLILDEVEGLAAPARAALVRLLDLAPDARLVCTSQAVLAVEGERVIDLPSLSEEAALDLFLLRARQARPGLELDASTLAVARRIVADLDHLPLAIELAAAWLDLVGLEELHARLARPLSTLRDPHGTSRHASLERTLRRSWEMLDADLRDLLGQLAMFEGAFDLGSAEAVVRPSRDLLPALRRSVDRSWLRRTPDGRLGMLRIVRSFVRVQPAQSARATADRHLAWLLRLARAGRIDAGLRADAIAGVLHGLQTDPARGGELLLHLDRVLESAHLRHDLLARACGRVPRDEVELWIRLQVAYGEAVGVLDQSDLEPLHRALQRARELGRADLLALTLVRLGPAQAWAGTAEARTTLEEALVHAATLGHEPLHVEALVRLALQVRTDGETDAALAYLARAKAIAERLPDDEPLAEVLFSEGTTHVVRGKLALAAQSLRRARKLTRSPRTRAHVDVYLGTVYTRQGALERGVALLVAAADFFQARGEPLLQAHALGCCAEARLRDGDTDRALELTTAGRRAILHTGTPRIAAFDLALAEIHRARGELDVARTQIADAIAAWRGIGELRHIGVAEMIRGQIEHAAGDLRRAEEAYRSALDLLPGRDPRTTTASAWLAALLAERGAVEEARRVAPDLDVIEADEEEDRRAANLLCVLVATEPAAGRSRAADLRPSAGYQTRIALSVLGRALLHEQSR